MRFEELRLLAFGPFTGERLDLRGGAPGGLHVIYGPNEAGKSTALRAVKNFLYGIPRRTPDAHLHPLPRLSIGAILSHEGRNFEFARLKRNRDDLVGPDGSPVSTNPLPQLLGFLDETSFSLRFGLDQVELEKGAEALLGGSEQGLFAAGTAGADARRLLSSLDEEASNLFLPRGKLPLLNKQNADYERALSELRRAERPVEKWMNQKQAHQEAVAHVNAIQTLRSEVRGELRRLNRLKAVMSDLFEWQKADHRLHELRQVADLPVDAFHRRLQLAAQVSESQAEARRIAQDLSAFESEWALVPEPSPLANVDDEQLELGARVGTAISARKDLPKRRAALLEQERQIAVLLRDLGRGAAAGTELHVAKQVLVGAEVTGTAGRLITQRSGLDSSLSSAEARLGRLTQQVGQDEELESPSDPLGRLDRLEALLAQAKVVQGIFAESRQEQKIISQLVIQIERLRLQLGCSVTWQHLSRNLPGSELVHEQLSSWTQCMERLAAVEQERSALQVQLNRCLTRPNRLAHLPTEHDLEETRNRRNEALRAYQEPQVEAFEPLVRLVELADSMADQMRSHADQVYEALAFAREIEELEQRLLQLEVSVSAARTQTEVTQLPLLALAQSLELKLPAAPNGVTAWYSSLSKLVDLEMDHQARLSELERDEALVRKFSEQLAAELQGGAAGLNLAGLLQLLEREVRQAIQARERLQLKQQNRRLLEQEYESALVELDAARSRLVTWKEAWGRALGPLGLHVDSSVERAQAVLHSLQRLEPLVEVASVLESRIQGMVRDTEALERDINSYVRKYLPEHWQQEDPVEQAIHLQQSIRVARHQRDERQRIRALIDERRATLSIVQDRQKVAHDQIATMLELAGVQTEQQLAEAEVLSNEKRQLKVRTQELVERIRVSSDGASLEELVVEAAPWNGAVRRLVVRIDELDQQGADLEEELRQAEADAESTRLGLLAYQTADVALARQATADRAASACATLREYLVKRAAHTLLCEQVSRYAERFSGPIAGRASELFHRITLGKYSRLSVGLGERSLRCVRDGLEVDVAALSRGTRAQLYFVLRLASLERYFEEHPPVPLIFDDLLVDFDDDRTTVAFELLAELAERVQILYFTHLARDVEKAHDAVPSRSLFTHTIGIN